MAFYILGVFLVILVTTALVLHYGFQWAGILPDPSQATVVEREFFKFDYTFFLNLFFILLSALFFFLQKGKKEKDHKMESSLGDKVLYFLSVVSFIWLAGGWIVGFIGK